jgi:AraC-like DNA-binding protein
MANGSQAVIFPTGRRHRIAHGVYTPCRLLWMVFQSRDVARESARLFPRSEIEALFDMAESQEAPVDLPEACCRNLGDLCARLTDDRLLIGSAPLMAEVRAKIYSSVIALWDVCASGRNSASRSQLVRRAAKLLREGADKDDCDKDERIRDVARQLGYGKSRLYSLFSREVGMAPNDYRQRIRIKRCCEKLVQTDDPITVIGVDSGFGSSQYFSRVFKKYVGVTPTDYRRLFGSRPIG